MENQKDNFRCRVCTHTEYDEIRQSNGIYGPGGHSRALYYFCKGCGVIFIKPKLFSISKPQDKEK